MLTALCMHSLVLYLYLCCFQVTSGSIAFWEDLWSLSASLCQVLFIVVLGLNTVYIFIKTSTFNALNIPWSQSSITFKTSCRKLQLPLPFLQKITIWSGRIFFIGCYLGIFTSCFYCIIAFHFHRFNVYVENFQSYVPLHYLIGSESDIKEGTMTSQWPSAIP